MQQLEPDWQLDTDQQDIRHCYQFKNYYQTIAFVNIIPKKAHHQNHHPDQQLGYNKSTGNYRNTQR